MKVTMRHSIMGNLGDCTIFHADTLLFMSCFAEKKHNDKWAVHKIINKVEKYVKCLVH